jgi:pimeloyl-ACP methyl ester carboxylesterase
VATMRRLASLAWAAWVLASAGWLAVGCGRDVPPDSPEPQAESAPQTEFVDGRAGRLYVDDGGAGGLPVVFVHSYAGSSAHWAAQLAHLRPAQRAVALDSRGHGRSEAPAAGDYAVESLAADIAAVVDALGLERFVLVGHSMGGAAALAYAAAHPERVAGLVLVGTPGKSSPEQARRVLGALEADYDKTMGTYWQSLLTGARPEVAARIEEERKSVPREASLAIIRAIFDYDPTPALKAYPGPKLLVDTAHGESPGALHNLAPEVPRQVVVGTSHWPQLDKPEEVNRILDEFLATTK